MGGVDGGATAGGADGEDFEGGVAVVAEDVVVFDGGGGDGLAEVVEGSFADEFGGRGGEEGGGGDEEDGERPDDGWMQEFHGRECSASWGGAQGWGRDMRRDLFCDCACNLILWVLQIKAGSIFLCVPMPTQVEAGVLTDWAGQGGAGRVEGGRHEK